MPTRPAAPSTWAASRAKVKIKGLTDAAQTEKELRAAVEERFSPRLEVKYDILQSQTAKVLRIQTPKGPDMPYAIDDNKFYVRDEADTSLAVRDEIVALVREAFGLERDVEPEATGELIEPPPSAAATTNRCHRSARSPSCCPKCLCPTPATQGSRGGSRSGSRRGQQGSPNGAPAPARSAASRSSHRPRSRQSSSPDKLAAGKPATNKPAPKSQSPQIAQAHQQPKRSDKGGQPAQSAAAQPQANGAVDTTFYLPQIGVEIIEAEERNGHIFYAIRDMRNGNVIKNITRHGARKLWSYAIEQYEKQDPDQLPIEWQGNIGLVRAEKRVGKLRYDLALREGDDVRIFYGVTEDGMEGAWSTFLADE